ncbi:MAG: PQQ-binding-like beta-propeller repeat protein [Aureliella sp.]
MRSAFVAPLACLLTLIAAGDTLRADDWPNFQGPTQDSRSAETGLLSEWPDAGPEMAWKIESVGVGYSAPTVVGDTIYLLGARGGKTEMFALSAKDGSEKWSLVVNNKPFNFDGNAWGIGPRSSATVTDGRVFGMAGDGKMVCADLDGNEIWRVDMQADLGGEVNPIGGGPKTFGWGFCWSPIVDGDKLICTPGGPKGLVAALECATGKVVWRSADLPLMGTYASPVIAEIHGVRQYVVMTQKGAAGVGEDGSLLWEHVRKRPYSDVVIPTPVVSKNHVYTSVGYGGAGCELLTIVKTDDGFTVESEYSTRNAKIMKNNLGGFVLHEGHIFGCSDRRGWVCQELATGDMKWYKRGAAGFPDGSIIFADNHLYLLDERGGEVALIEASPEAWNLKGRFTLPALSEKRAPSGRTWTHPVIADGHLYLRDQELLYSYKLN